MCQVTFEDRNIRTMPVTFHFPLGTTSRELESPGWAQASPCGPERPAALHYGYLAYLTLLLLRIKAQQASVSHVNIPQLPRSPQHLGPPQPRVWHVAAVTSALLARGNDSSFHCGCEGGESETPETGGPAADMNTEKIHLSQSHGLSREGIWDQTLRGVTTWEMCVCGGGIYMP